MIVEKENLINAINMVFGNDFKSTNTVDIINHAVLKSYFRKKAITLHPDRSRQLGISKTYLTEQFKKLNEAYQYLSSTLDKHGHIDIIRDSMKAAQVKTKSSVVKPKDEKREFRNKYSERNFHKKKSKFFWSNDYYFPGKNLRFAQFLYYSHIINWKTLIDALVWQSQNRPKFGDIAVSWNILTRQQASDIMMMKRPGEFIGQAAVRLGYIDHFKLYAIIGKQKSYKFPIGRYFVEKGILSKSNLEDLIIEFNKIKTYPYFGG